MTEFEFAVLIVPDAKDRMSMHQRQMVRDRANALIDAVTEIGSCCE